MKTGTKFCHSREGGNPVLRSLFIFCVSLFCILHSAFPLQIENGPAANITATNAILAANLVSTNTTNAAVTVYYGAGNGGTNIALWQYSNYFGVVSTGLHSFTTTNLTPATYYYYRGRALEGTTNIAWASASSNFSTLARAPTNYPASTNDITQTVGPNGLWKTPSRANVIAANGLISTSDLSGYNAQFLAVSTRVDIAEGNITAHATNNANPHAVSAAQTGAVPTNDPVYQCALTNAGMITTGTVWQIILDPVTRKLTIYAVTNAAYDNLLTNTATKAQGALADTALQPYTEWLSKALTNTPSAGFGIVVAGFNIAGAPSTFPIGQFLETNGSGAGLSGITVAQVGGAATNDASVTNARPWNSPDYNVITNPPTIPTTNELASTNWIVARGYITNAITDLSGWSGVNATQKIMWAYASTVTNTITNLSVTGATIPPGSGIYVETTNNGNRRWASTNGFICWYDSGATEQYIGDTTPPHLWVVLGGGNAAITGIYYAAIGIATGDLDVAWSIGYVTNIVTNTWMVGVTNHNKWGVTYDGTNFITVYPSSNVFINPLYGNGLGLTNISVPATNSMVNNITDLQTSSNSLNTAVGNLNTSTNSLNTRMGSVETATNTLNTRAGNLESATNTLNTVANAALPKAGGIMTGPMTNNAGYYGNGVGLTGVNATVAGVVTNPVGANVNFNNFYVTNVLTVVFTNGFSLTLNNKLNGTNGLSIWNPVTASNYWIPTP